MFSEPILMTVARPVFSTQFVSVVKDLNRAKALFTDRLFQAKPCLPNRISTDPLRQLRPFLSTHPTAWSGFGRPPVRRIVRYTDES